jgi:hypothetical protein
MPLKYGRGRHTFTPLQRRWVVGRRLRGAAVARVRGVTGPLGPLATWCGALPVPSFALGMAARCHVAPVSWRTAYVANFASRVCTRCSVFGRVNSMSVCTSQRWGVDSGALWWLCCLAGRALQRC